MSDVRRCHRDRDSAGLLRAVHRQRGRAVSGHDSKRGAQPIRHADNSSTATPAADVPRRGRLRSRAGDLGGVRWRAL